MGYTCRCSSEERLMYCDLTGPADLRETTAMFREMASESCIGEGWGILVDTRRREGTPTTEGIEYFVNALSELRQRLSGRIAFVSGFPAQYGMARMLEIRAELAGVEARAFLHEDEARHWLSEVSPALAARGSGSTEGDIAEMLGLAKGILADGVVTSDEATMLGSWMDAHPEIVERWPGNVLSRRLRQIFEDRVVTAEECSDLAELLRDLVGGRIGILKGGATALPLDDPRPVVEVAGRAFVFTGRFAYGSPNTVEEAIHRLGGHCETDLSARTDFFVVGTFGSREWIHSNWGREIAKAVDQRRRTGRPFIIAEDHWVDAVGAR